MRATFGKDERVVFEPIEHKYTKGGYDYISVTTLIEHYHSQFKGDYWSTYKAVKDELESISSSVWSDYKKRAYGWKNVVDLFNKEGFNQLNGRTGIGNEVNIEIRKQEYLDEWEHERSHASDLGNRFHDGMEDDVLNNETYEDHGSTFKVSEKDIIDMRNNLDELRYNDSTPELQLWNDKYKIAGKADLVERERNSITISDYKTCKEITMEPWDGEAKFFKPLQELPDANYFKFTMQFSLYAWMLEQEGFEIHRLILIHVDRDTQEHIRNYIMAYRDDLVLKMINDYAGRQIL